MIYHIERIYSVRVNEKEWTRQHPDITFVDVDLEYMDEDTYEINREVFTMEIEDLWFMEEYGYFTSY